MIYIMSCTNKYIYIYINVSSTEKSNKLKTSGVSENRISDFQTQISGEYHGDIKS